MIDTIAIKQGADLFALVGRDVKLTRKAKTNGGEWAGHCPWCGGVDRFIVWPNAVNPGWWCRQCGRAGDAIDYLKQRENLGFREACEILSGGAPMPECNRSVTTPADFTTYQPKQPPPKEWQDKARRIIDDCERNLWADIGAKARAWLAARGLWEETLLGWRVGYCPKDGYYHGQKMERGIVIPWFDSDATIWKLNVRRPVGKPKYKAVAGSILGLFAVHRLTGKQDCVIVEGEFDALLVWQELGDLDVEHGVSDTFFGVDYLGA